MLRIKLSPEQRSELQELGRDKSLKPAERDRVEMVFLADAGWTVAQIAEHLECHPQTVRRLFARYEQARARRFAIGRRGRSRIGRAESRSRRRCAASWRDRGPGVRGIWRPP